MPTVVVLLCSDFRIYQLWETAVEKKSDLCVRLDQQEVCVPVDKQDARVIRNVLTGVAVFGLTVVIVRALIGR